MSGLEWLAVALLALALAFPAGVAFGIRIGQMRERDRFATSLRRMVDEGLPLTAVQQIIMHDIIHRRN